VSAYVVHLTHNTSNLYERLRGTVGDNRRGYPVTILFADAAYSGILDNWLRHAYPYVSEALIVFSLDASTHARMSARGITSFRLPFSGALDELWLLRLSVFEALILLRANFIHSDVDAVWLADPRQFCCDLKVDLAISSGTIWPSEALDQWGFVLCCGFFCVRATPEMARFFAEIRRVALDDRDDQAALNKILVEAGTTWKFDAIPHDIEEVTGRRFRNFDRVVFGRTTSKFDLRVALLPQNLFQRIPRIYDKPFVKHPLTPKDLRKGFCTSGIRMLAGLNQVPCGRYLRRRLAGRPSGIDVRLRKKPRTCEH
jgi:hypothetical protein